MIQVTPATEALAASGIDFQLTEHGPVRSLEEAAAARGLEPRHIIKTIVVRRGEGDFIFVLVPGDREISWPKLILAGAVQGAIFRAVKEATDHGSRRAFMRVTGTWPGEERPEPE